MKCFRMMADTHGDVAAGTVAVHAAELRRLSHRRMPMSLVRGRFCPTVTKSYSRRQLAEAILIPSKNILEGFKTQDHRHGATVCTVQGFVTSETTNVDHAPRSQRQRAYDCH